MKLWNKKGFTLVEMLVVLFILGILAALAGPNLTNMFSKNKMRTSTSAVTSTLYLARMKAINDGELFGVEFFEDGIFNIVQDPYGARTVIGTPYQLEEGITFADISFVSWLAVFTEYGQLDKNCLSTGETIGVIQLTDGFEDSTMVEVTFITGRIRETQ